MMTIAELKDILEARRVLVEGIEAMKSQEEAIDNLLKQEMTEAQVEELKVGEFTVRYKEIVSRRLDTNRLKSAMSEQVWEGFCNTQTSMRFTVTEK